jgi:hypothetical protein
MYLHILAVFLIYCLNSVYAENIDPNDDGSQYAYGENIGWINFEPNITEPNVGATVSSDKVTGFIWAENIGWINLDPNDSEPNTGIINDGTGILSGYAWGENVGWINFWPNVPDDANHYGVTIDANGVFDGWAWGENIGWINFNSAQLHGYGVQVCKVNYVDLANFVNDWLKSGLVPGNLDAVGDVEFHDYGILASYWLDYCPEDWPLK